MDDVNRMEEEIERIKKLGQKAEIPLSIAYEDFALIPKREAEITLASLGRSFSATTTRLSKKRMEEMSAWELREMVYKKHLRNIL